MKIHIIRAKIVFQRDTDHGNVVHHIQNVYLGPGIGGSGLGGAVKAGPPVRRK